MFLTHFQLFVPISGEGHKAAKQHVRQQKLAGISKVMGVSKLRTKYEAPEAKRQLCSSYDIFLADQRVIPSLPKLLGESTGPQMLQSLMGTLQEAFRLMSIQGFCLVIL